MKQFARITGLAALAALVLVGCGDSSSSSPTPFSSVNENLSSSSLPPTSSSSVLAVVDNKTIVGLAQKGPFVAGAGVKLWELDDETMARTNKVFTGTVSGGKGDFSVSGVTLASPYAVLEVNGRYINEVAGAESERAISLSALVDLTGRGGANVNMLTHLEYGRALYLVSTGMNVAEAKRQAEREIFAEFGIAGDFADSEELDIFSTDDGGVALLAISVLMQGDLSEAELSRRLADFAADIEEDGEWNDDSTKARMADWAYSTDLKGSSDRSSVWTSFSLPSKFVPIVRNFWWNRFGLGACSAQNKDEVKRNADSLSGLYGDYFLCGETARNEFDWRLATVIEYDTYQWTAADDGTIRKGDVTDSHYKYDSLQGKWTDANRLDMTLGLNGCTQKRETEVASGSDNNVYVCADGQWCVATLWNVPKELRLNPNIPYGTITDGRDGQTYKTVVIGSQTWMAENLNYEYKVNGSTYGNWCYNDSARYCSVTGRLYTWGAAMDSVATDCGYHKKCAVDTGRVQGVCPDGWHLPSLAEWDTLVASSLVGGVSVSARALKTTSGWSKNGNGKDVVGFSALPSGEWERDGYYHLAGEAANFWSSWEEGESRASSMHMISGDTRAYQDFRLDKRYGFAVRCIKD